MKLVGIQIGKIEKIEFNSRTMQSGINKKSVNQNIKLNLLGVEGDYQADQKHHGGVDKACYAFSADAYDNFTLVDKINKKFGSVGENLTIENFDENKIYIGDLLKIGDCTLQVTSPRIPCATLNIKFQNLQAVKLFTLHARPGFYLRVLNEGMLKANLQVTITNSESVKISIAEVFKVAMKLEKIESFNQRVLSLKTMDDKIKTKLIELNLNYKSK